MRGVVTTAGELVGVDARAGWADRILGHAIPDGCLSPKDPASVPLTVTAGARQLADPAIDRSIGRGIAIAGDAVVFRSAATSGIDLRVAVDGEDSLRVEANWSPPLRDAIVNKVLAARARLLGASILLNYPALWRAGWFGRVPLHAGALVIDGVGVVVTGPSQTGKSTLALHETAAGASLVSDNLIASDGETAWGLVEPVRVEGGSGPQTTAGRREMAVRSRVARVRADVVVVLRRSQGAPSVRRITPEAAARELVAATYGAGELRRYWSFASALALGSGRGPVHPSVTAVAETLCQRSTCLELDVGERPGAHLTTCLRELEVPRWR